MTPRIFIVAAALFLIANKGCEKGARWEHPILEKDVPCAACHDDGRTREKRPAGHDLAWQKNHGAWIRKTGLRQASSCTVCHTEATCTACHQQEKPRDHTPFWRLKGHGPAVGLNRGRCMTCHGGADFCERCHSETRPVDHSAAWGAPSNRHCLGCHFPVTSAGGQRCFVCHEETPSHSAAPSQPDNALHRAGVDCRSCHSPLRHPDNGMSCTACHAR